MSNYSVRRLETDEYNLWNEMVDRSREGSVFSKTFWLDAVQCNYYILGCFDKSGRLAGGIPIVENKKGYITMPKLTQSLGIVIDDFGSMKYVNRITKEKDIILSIVEAMPEFTKFEYGFHYNFNNWMPFLWNGYNQYTRYTYVIENIKDIEKVKSGFTDNTKSTINKALKSNLKVVNNLSTREMYNMEEKTFKRQNMKVPFEYKWFENFDRVLQANNAREMFFAIDEEGNLHASLYLVYDSSSAYYLLGGGDPEFRNSGAMYLNIFEAIKCASNYTDKFDFEGSIVPQIEHMFRSFGGTLTPYFSVSKNRSILENLKLDIRKYGKIILKR